MEKSKIVVFILGLGCGVASQKSSSRKNEMMGPELHDVLFEFWIWQLSKTENLPICYRSWPCRTLSDPLLPCALKFVLYNSLLNENLKFLFMAKEFVQNYLSLH